MYDVQCTMFDVTIYYESMLKIYFQVDIKLTTAKNLSIQGKCVLASCRFSSEIPTFILKTYLSSVPYIQNSSV